MSLLQANLAGLGGSGAPGGALGTGDVFSHTIDNSARFSDASNTTLIFTPGTPSSTSVWTMSVWMKKYNPDASGSDNEFFSAGTSGSAYSFLTFSAANQQFLIANEQSGTKNKLWYNKRFRDPAAWFHLVLRSDLGESTQDDRLKLYINGELQTSTSDGLTMSSWSYINASGVTQNWGGKSGVANSNPGCDFYLADINFTDGQSYAPTEFGETKDGVWVPINPSVTYGNNGYRLEFKQTGTGGASSSTIGADTSGNDNHFTDSGFDATDIGIPDTPTNNFATLNPIGEFYGESSNTKTFSEGNLQVAQSGGGSHDTATIAIETGHTEGYYWEVIVSSMDTSRTYIGIVADHPDGNASLIASYGFTKKYILNRDGTFWGNNDSNASGTSSYTAYAQGDIVMVAYKNGKIWFGVNGTWMNSGDPANGTGFLTAQDGTSPSDRNQAAWLPYFGYRSTFITNFGQNGTFNGTKTAQGNADENGIGNFYYSVPSGFLALCTANLPDPTIGPGQSEQADDNFNPILYTGSDFTTLHIGAGGARRPADTITIANSLQFSDSSLHRDITSSGNTRTWTWSAWVKRSSLGGSGGQYLFTDGRSSSLSSLNFDSNDKLYIQLRDTTGSTSKYKLTTRTFKSLSTWYHIVWRVDTTQSTDADRSRIYINGTQITAFDAEQHVDQNDETTINASGDDHLLGAYRTSSTIRHFDGYMAEINFADGQSYGPETFGQVGANGDWIPKTISGVTYGQNGFRLTFQTPAYPEYDYQTSDRSTANDFDKTDNVASPDVLIDSPTQNFCTMDSQRYSGAGNFSKGNLTVQTASNNRATHGTIAVPSSGKWYYEVRVDSYVGGGGAYMGWATDIDLGDNEYAVTKGIFFSSYNEQVLLDGSGQSGGYGSTGTDVASNGDVYSILLDVDNLLFYYAKNGTYFNSANPSNGTGGLSVSHIITDAETAIHASLSRGGSYNETYTFNFGQDASFHDQETAPGTDKTDSNGVGKFLYDVPTGFLALMDDNIPQEGVISPDFVWIKKRSGTSSHYMFDTVRGVGKDLHPHENHTEASSAATLKSFDSQGFTVGLTTDLNDKDATYVAWTWKADGPAPTQTYAVTVSGDSGSNKYRFDGNTTDAPTLNLQQGGTYTFDQSDSSNDGHPLRFSTTSDGTHGGGSQYTVGVTTTGTPGTSGAKTVITVAWGAPTLYYYCTQHSGMGGQVNTIETRGSSNFKGSIPSIVSANTSAGFSIVSYTGTGSNGTIGHGLSNPPEAIIIKARTRAENWLVYHKFDGGTDGRSFLNFNNTNDKFDNGPGSYFQDTPPTSSLFYQNGSSYNVDTDTYIAYCFHSVEGYSKIGSFRGNSSTDGAFVNLGFRPAWVLIKSSSNDGTSWCIFDNKRLGYNVDNNLLRVAGATEQTDDDVDFVSNGLKFRRSSSNFNSSGYTYTYIAFAEAPFKFANAR